MARDSKAVRNKLKKMTKAEVKIYELIKRRRLQILVHSYLYYECDYTLISDQKYDKWARELVLLQNKYKKIAKLEMHNDIFEGYDGSSGFNLKIDDGIKSIANNLVHYYKSEIAPLNEAIIKGEGW